MTPSIPNIDFADPDSGLAGAHVLRREQVIPVERGRVFEFFSDPANLETLTPPWLHFQIVDSPDALAEGALIRYSLRLHGIPLQWKTRIEDWQPGVSFVDTQLSGPYKLWHHTHEFEDAAGGGTVIRDIVRYKVPLGALGEVARRALVRPDTEKIFDFRHAAIEREFGGGLLAAT
jgi:ligand-binding SRPBCC domain-containing protein